MHELSLADKERLTALYERLVKETSTYIGYPNSKYLSHQNLAPFLDLPLNNVGDPFIDNNGPNTLEMEREVLEFYRELLKMQPDNYWGYVTNGGTEANMYGLWLARETYPAGIVYFSDEAHYSVPKAAKLLRMRSVTVQSGSNGEMRYSDLRERVRVYNDKPAIVVANIGTTMKGAIDNVEKIVAVLRSAGVRRTYIHCDAALFGAYLPFYPDAPKFDFRMPVGSVAISGHKFLGSAIPCGVVMARKTYVDAVRSTPEYISSVDDTISGSRDGFSALVLWHNIRRFGYEGMEHLADVCLDLTEYALERLRGANWPAWTNPYSNIVVIGRPPEAIVRKWQLAVQGTMAHIVVMPGVSREMIDNFVDDIQAAAEMEEESIELPKAA